MGDFDLVSLGVGTGNEVICFCFLNFPGNSDGQLWLIIMESASFLGWWQ